MRRYLFAVNSKMSNPFAVKIHPEYVELSLYLESDSHSVTLSRACETLATTCIENNVKRALTRVNLPLGNISVLNIFGIATQLAKSIPGLHLALVFEEDDSDDLKDFLQLAGINRGLTIDFFSDCESASRWLRNSND